jgi:hypothetical protein
MTALTTQRKSGTSAVDERFSIGGEKISHTVTSRFLSALKWIVMYFDQTSPQREYRVSGE